MKKRYEELDFWRFEQEFKPLLKVEDVLYTLDGWNGKSFQFSREVLNLDKQEVSHTLYCVTPEYVELNNDMMELDIVDYHVSLY